MVKSVYDIFETSQTTSSKKEKEGIIKQNTGNELFMEVLKFVYNDFITIGIRKDQG